MDDLTVIYYTSNREDPQFEKRIQQTLLKATGTLPIISVSQKPIDFGKNICVGDIGANDGSLLYQLHTGVLAAKTKFTVQAEADCLYHKSYFEFEPERDDTIYQPDSFYILWPAKPAQFYWKKRGDLSGFINREHFIKILEKLRSTKFEYLNNVVKKHTRVEQFHNEIPIVSFKTRNGMHYGSPIRRKKSQHKLPHWGKSRQVVKEYT